MSKFLRVLVVDDSEDDRRVIRRFLTRGITTRYRVDDVATADQALVAIDERMPDVLILDQHLGTATGLEILQIVRQRGLLRLAVVFLTGSGGEMGDPIVHGADDFLGKEDLTSAQLRRAVENAVVKARMRYELQTSRAELAVALGELKQRADFEGRLLGVVSHDLRSPLTTISVACDMLHEYPLPKDARDLVEMAERNATKMQRMVNQLLDLTRVKSQGGFSLEGRLLDLGALLEEIVRDFGTVHTAQRFDVDCAAPSEVWCDPVAMTQIIENLVRNALQHSEAGHPIAVTAREADGEVHVTVANRGAPIPAELRARLFEPFRRGAASGQGLGLGLYITRELARAHGGEVDVACGDGKVAFTVRWPVLGPSPAAAAST